MKTPFVSGKAAKSGRYFIGLPVLASVVLLASLYQEQTAAKNSSGAATYSNGIFRVSMPYDMLRAGTGTLIVEVLDPDDKVIGQTRRAVRARAGQGSWQDQLQLRKELATEDLIWYRLRYRFTYQGEKKPAFERIKSISQILRMPVVHVIAQNSYLSGATAAVRLIVTDSKNEPIADGGSARIELQAPQKDSRVLFTGSLDRRGTADAQFAFPRGLAGDYSLHFAVDTSVGSADFTQPIRLDEKVSMLLTTEKPIYQPGQTIHARTLALDRADHAASTGRKLTFELEDSRGNKVFKKVTQTDTYGIASAEFGLADEVNLGTYHLRAVLDGSSDKSENTAEIALNVQQYVLPKFKVAVDLAEKGSKSKHGYRPGDHVTGTVRANYFFGKPVDRAEISVKATAMDVALFEAGTSQGKTDTDGAYRFDIHLPNYFAGHPLSEGAARVLIEATVKDSAGHSETRGEPITVSESPLLITAIPEGGTLIPGLENQVFVIASYPDGTPAQANIRVHAAGNADQAATTDASGVATVQLLASGEETKLQVEANDAQGSQTSVPISLQARSGPSQVLLRTERAVYRVGDRIKLQVFSTEPRGNIYLDLIKDAQTIETRDLDVVNGHASIDLPVTPELAGTVEVNAYLFGEDAVPVADHRLLFVQPADELKIETEVDCPVYKPGGEARIAFRVTNTKGQGVEAALGLQIVDEAVFALAEKQPGFAKLFFYLEQEVMKPRYEIHSLDMRDSINSAGSGEHAAPDRAARALFSATDLVRTNAVTTEFGRDVEQAKYWEYASRYRVLFADQVGRLADAINAELRKNAHAGNIDQIIAGLEAADTPELRDSWGNALRIEVTQPANGIGSIWVRSAGPDGQFKTPDDLSELLQIRRLTSGVGKPEEIDLKIEHDRGALNGLGEIDGTVRDITGAKVQGASIDLRNKRSREARTAITDREGRFIFAGVPPDVYELYAVSPGFEIATKAFSIRARDRAILDIPLMVGSIAQQVEVTPSGSGTGSGAYLIAGSVNGAVAGGMFGDRFARTDGTHLGTGNAPLPQAMKQFARAQFASVSVTRAPLAAAAPAAHVRSFFPEALYINPEIITDHEGRASITVPVADNITTWRLAMLASTPHGALGNADSSFKVFQDFFVDLDLPVTLTQGDQVSIPVAVYNYSGSAGKVHLQLQPEDWFSLVADTPAKTIDVEAGRVGGSQFTIEARRIGKFKLRLSAGMSGSAKRADIVVREIEVVPDGREQSMVFNGRLETTVRQELNFPPSSIADARTIFVRLYPGPLSQVIEGMDSLLQMPSGCFEQTSSSTYPNVLALDYMKRTKKLTPEVHAKAEGYIANGYQRLLTFEVPGGGFSWFGAAPANKILTSYGLMEFSDMAKVHDVDERLIGRTQQWLAQQQQADGSWKPDEGGINEGATNRYTADVLRITAYIAWSLESTGFEGPAIEKAKQFVETHINEKADAYTLAVVANFATDYAADRTLRNQVMKLLLDARTENGEQAWWKAEETGVFATGRSAAVEATGLAAQALLKWGEEPNITRRAMNFITASKDASGTWGTTQATIMALRALLLSTGKGGGDANGSLELLCNGKVAEKLAITEANNDLLHQFVIKGVDAQSANLVELRFTGHGSMAYQLAGRYFLPWDQKPAAEALSIDVSYDRTHLYQDDIATATATVRNNLDKTARMVMVDLGIPPGFELLSEDLQSYEEKTASRNSGRLEKFSLTATQAILYFDSIAPHSEFALKFRLRAKYPIRARTFASRVYEYYDPDVSSLAKPIELETYKQ